MNLSNLTNAIKVPVLTYPDSYPDTQQIAVEKRYNLWTIDCCHLDPSFEFCDTSVRRLRSGKGTQQ